MRVLLDNCVDAAFREHVSRHEVVHVLDIGWEAYLNGTLLSSAETSGFDVLVTVDKSMQNQQNFAKRKIGLVVLNSRLVRLADLIPLAPKLQVLLDAGVAPGSVTLIGPEPV
jgi:hypothetical protein